MMITKKFWDMPHKAVVFMAVCGLAFNADIQDGFASEPLSVASTSLCGDSYLIALAPERIAALSWQSRDAVSRADDAQRRLPQVWDDPEQIMRVKADMILFGPGEGLAASRFLSKTPLKSHQIKWGEDFQSVKENYSSLEKVFWGETTIERKLADLDSRLSALMNRKKARQFVPKVLYLSRAGGTAGQATYVNAAIAAAGGQNVIKSTGWLTLDPESIISLDPDIIVTSFMNDGYESINSNGLRHKIMGDFIRARPQVNVPGALWPCAGPGLIEAAEIIAEGLDKLK